jgi:hypothetical protein
VARAKHFALAAQYRDAHSCLTNNGLLDIADSRVLSQFDELFVPSSDAEPVPDEPGDLFTDKKYDFEIGDIWVKNSGGEPMQVPCFPWVMDHLPRYKAAGPCGDRYEHYLAMPPSFVCSMASHVLNGQISTQFQSAWCTGLVHAGDKGKLDSQHRPKARPIVVGLALRRITERIPCAQLKGQFNCQSFRSCSSVGRCCQ